MPGVPPTARTGPPPERPGAVPVRTIVATIGLVLVTLLTIYLVRELARIIAWVMVAGFFAIILGPAVDFLQTRLRMRRAPATMLVFIAGVIALAAMLYAFIRPIVDQVQEFADNLPAYVEDAKEGRGAIGELVQRYDIDEFVEENRDRFEAALSDAGAPALDIARTVANTLFALLSILVLAFLMLLQGPSLLRGAQLLVPERSRDRVRHVASDCSRAVTGYMAGNLVISVIAGIATYAFLFVAGVPFREVLALWVAFADLIPLVGATLGAIPTIAVAFLHSTPAGIAAVVFFIAYQQFENHVLQVTVMSRTVDLNPLAVLISVMVGVELFGILGALLAIPAAGVIQVIVRDLYDEHRGRMKAEPTVGADELPIGETAPPSAGGVDNEVDEEEELES